MAKQKTKLKRKLYAIQGGKCYLCGKPMWMQNRPKGGPRAQNATVDHVKPRAGGGKDKPGNLALACKPCNEKKAARKPTIEEMAVAQMIQKRMV